MAKQAATKTQPGDRIRELMARWRALHPGQPDPAGLRKATEVALTLDGNAYLPSRGTLADSRGIRRDWRSLAAETRLLSGTPSPAKAAADAVLKGNATTASLAQRVRQVVRTRERMDARLMRVRKRQWKRRVRRVRARVRRERALSRVGAGPR